MPEGVLETFSMYANITTSDEKAFVFSTKKTFDFIFSDADHNNAQDWFSYTYDKLLQKDGILIYHDVDIPNLRRIYLAAQKQKLRYKLFDRNSLPNERCNRGLLVIFK